VLVIVSTLFITLAAAQTMPSGSPSDAQPAQYERGELFNPHPVRFIRKFAKEEYRIWTSPFRTSNYDSHAIKKYVVPFVVISGALIATDLRTTQALPNTADQTKWSGRVSQMGAGYTLAGISGATFLLGQATKNDHARETGLLALEALAHAQVVAFGIKQITNRARPTDNDQRRGFWNGGNSFPSGHATSAFSVAAVFAYEYRHHIAVPITAYTLASVVAASRLGAHRHWFADVFVGGSTGFLLGRYVYKKHHDPGLPGSPVQRTHHWKPDIGIGRSGVALAWRW
jgi:membrane-associated phospholipid phosphatase